jgi:hypothetical protein
MASSTAGELCRSGKKLQARVAELQGSETALPVEVWAFDEHRLGLKPILRKVWAPRGCRPIASGHHRYQWLYLYGFVRPATGEVVWFIAGQHRAVQRAPGVVRRRGRPDKHIILVLDGAGWHVARDLVVPEALN